MEEPIQPFQLGPTPIDFSRSLVKRQGHMLNIVVNPCKQDKPLLYCHL